MAPSTVDLAARYAAEALVSIGAAVADLDTLTQALALLGWDAPPGIDLLSVMTIDVSDVAQKLAVVVNSTPSERSDDVLMAERYAALLTAVGSLTGEISAFATALPGKLAAAGDYVTKTAIGTELPRRVLDLLTVSELGNSPPALMLLVLLGIVRFVEYPADPTIYQVPHVRTIVEWDRIGQLLSDPRQVFVTEYGWGTAAFDAEKLLTNIGLFLQSLSARPFIRDLPQSVEEMLAGSPVPEAATDPSPQLLVNLVRETSAASIDAGLSVHRLRPTSTGGLDAGLEFVPYVRGSVALEFPIIGRWTLGADATLDLENGIGIGVRPGAVTLRTGLLTGTLADVTGRAGLVLHIRPAQGQRFRLLTIPGGSAIEFEELSLEGGITTDSSQSLDPFIELKLTGGHVLLTTGAADAFLKQVLPASLDSTFDLTAQWSQHNGLHFSGSGQLDINISLALDLGLIDLTNLHITVKPSANNVVVTTGISGGLQLGPLQAVVQGIGVTGTLAFENGNLGPIDLALGFRPPDGIGISVNAEPVTGVGFIAFDEADARYLGAIALQVGDVAISAVGVLDTKVPGGGYSLIVVASAQFPPIQLGFGFSLSAIGGLVGVNRTADVPTLQALARAGRLDDLMFPADLVHRAPQVAANLAQQFPVAQGHFIIGPAVQIQWGAGGLIYADIGVFIELTDSGGGVTVLRIALLGLVHLTLPEGAAPVADITLDVLGVLDFAAQTLSLDAGLRNSTIATFPLTGQAALRAGWGSSPEFLFAVGGFNPCFQAPTGFPALQRVALSIGGDNPRLRLSAYLALTSNTLQLGCAADLYASVQAAGVTAAVAASLTFDALVQFKPFGLRVDLTISAAILINGNPILAMSLDLHVTGPNPWAVTGSASFQFLFATITIPVSIPGGTPAAPQPATPVDLDGNLLTALADPRSWATGPPTGRSLVRVRSQGSADTAVHPLGSLTVRQRAVPLGQRIECYGPDPVKPPCRYDITGTDLGTQPVAGTIVSDYFAPAQFRLMNDQDKLSSPSFESMTAGATLGSADLSLAPMPVPDQPPPPVVDSVSMMDWDTLTLDSPDPAPSAAQAAPAAGAALPVAAASGSTSVPDQLLAVQLGGAAAARSGPAGQPGVIYASPGIGIAVQDPYYAITGLDLGVPASTDLPSLTAGLTAAAQAGYQRDWQIVCTSEVG